MPIVNYSINILTFPTFRIRINPKTIPREKRPALAKHPPQRILAPPAEPRRNLPAEEGFPEPPAAAAAAAFGGGVWLGFGGAADADLADASDFGGRWFLCGFDYSGGAFFTAEVEHGAGARPASAAAADVAAQEPHQRRRELLRPAWTR